ncbi:MAG: hypothetical protein ABUS56_13215 [Acidobacteriota bacterium]
MSPILVRPVREQLEHDRVIRLLQAKNRRRFDAGMNPGAERNVAVGTGPAAIYPDLVLHSLERGHRLEAVVEVETGESVNHLEALAQWVPLSKLRVPFHLYVPSAMVDVARRLCEDSEVRASEIWSFNGIGDQIRFALVHRNREAPAPAPRQRPTAAKSTASKSVASNSTASNTAASSARKPAPARKAAPVRAAKPARRAPKPAPRKAKPVKKKGARPQKRR